MVGDDSRFFVAVRRGDSFYLDDKYVAFGRVVTGGEVLDDIERAGDRLFKKEVRIVQSGILEKND